MNPTIDSFRMTIQIIIKFFRIDSQREDIREEIILDWNSLSATSVMNLKVIFRE